MSKSYAIGFTGNETATKHDSNHCRYHDTNVVKVVNGKINLCHGGYPSMTTSKRINQWMVTYGYPTRVSIKNKEIVTNCGKIVNALGIMI